jgi:hypothetical protein
MWPPITTTSSGFSLPTISPTTLRDATSGSVCASMYSRSSTR